MSRETDHFDLGAEHFAGERLALLADGASAWVLTRRARRLGALRWDPRTDARWEIASRDGSWSFEWRGRWPRRFFGVDAQGEPVAWYVASRVRRAGTIVLSDGSRARLRRVPATRRWRLEEDGGMQLATLVHGRDADEPPVAVDVAPAARGRVRLTLVVLIACAAVRLDENLGTPVRTGTYPSVGG